MARIFNALRRKFLDEHRTGRYLRYAIGEIVLVVIGILIALQINNWNQERKESKLESKFVKLLVMDLRSDAESLAELTDISDASVRSKNKILDYQDGKITEPDSLSTHFLRAVFNGIPSFVSNRGAIDDIQNAGGLSLIKSEEVSSQILKLYNNYERFDKNVGRNYIEDREYTRQLVYQRANGDFFKRESDVDEEILKRLLTDSEIRNRLINNWAVTYNRNLKETLQVNQETIKVCKDYIQKLDV